MKYTWDCLLVQVFEREWDGNKFYKARVLTEDGEVFDLAVGRSLLKIEPGEPDIRTWKNVRVNAQVMVIAAKYNNPAFVLTAVDKI